jgi:ribosomal protein S21
MPAMAVRNTLSQCLRATPSALPIPLSWVPVSYSSIRGQYAHLQRSPYSSQSSPNDILEDLKSLATRETSRPKNNTTSSQTPPASKPDARERSSQFDNIMNSLDFNAEYAARTTEMMRQSDQGVQLPTRRRAADLTAMARAVGDSAETDNYRLPTRRIDLKLGTKLGRQVHVDFERGVDLASALRTLQMQCSSNQVPRQSRQQKFHVRRGQRRKELKSERWRKLFKFSFDSTVRRIQRMRSQGW